MCHGQLRHFRSFEHERDHFKYRDMLCHWVTKSMTLRQTRSQFHGPGYRTNAGQRYANYLWCQQRLSQSGNLGHEYDRFKYMDMPITD